MEWPSSQYPRGPYNGIVLRPGAPYSGGNCCFWANTSLFQSFIIHITSLCYSGAEFIQWNSRQIDIIDLYQLSILIVVLEIFSGVKNIHFSKYSVQWGGEGGHVRKEGWEGVGRTFQRGVEGENYDEGGNEGEHVGVWASKEVWEEAHVRRGVKGEDVCRKGWWRMFVMGSGIKNLPEGCGGGESMSLRVVKGGMYVRRDEKG